MLTRDAIPFTQLPPIEEMSRADLAARLALNCAILAIVAALALGVLVGAFYVCDYLAAL